MKRNKRHPLTFNKAGASFGGERKSGNLLLMERFCPEASLTQASSGTNAVKSLMKQTKKKKRKESYST